VQLDAAVFKMSEMVGGADIGGTAGTNYTLTLTAGH